jgi:hypothetical protein
MTTVVTKETGATAKPVGLLYIEPDLQVPDAGADTLLAETGLDATVVADLLSAAAAHLRCGVHLYRSCAARTTMGGLRTRYEAFARETLDGVGQLEELVQAAGGDPSYTSPGARAAEKAASAGLEATFMVEGSVDVETAELGLLDAVVAAETKARAQAALIAALGTQMPDGAVRTQFDRVGATAMAQADEHAGWASWERMRLLFGAATGGLEPPDPLPVGGEAAVDVTEMSRDELYSAAQQLDIEGRSSMNKDELAEAVASEQEAGR